MNLFGRTFRTIKRVELNLAKLRYVKCYNSLYGNLDCDYSNIVAEAINIIENDDSEITYSRILSDLGLEEVMEVLTKDYEFKSQTDLWNDNKKDEYNYYLNSIRFWLISDFQLLNTANNTDYKCFDFYKHRDCKH